MPTHTPLHQLYVTPPHATRFSCGFCMLDYTKAEKRERSTAREAAASWAGAGGCGRSDETMRIWRCGLLVTTAKYKLSRRSGFPFHVAPRGRAGHTNRTSHVMGLGSLESFTGFHGPSVGGAAPPRRSTARAHGTRVGATRHGFTHASTLHLLSLVYTIQYFPKVIDTVLLYVYCSCVALRPQWGAASQGSRHGGESSHHIPQGGSAASRRWS